MESDSVVKAKKKTIAKRGGRVDPNNWVE